MDVSVVNPQAASYVSKDAVVDRENAKRSRRSEAASEAGVEFCPFVAFGKFGDGEECVGCDCGVSAPVVPYPIWTSPAHWKGTFHIRRGLGVDHRHVHPPSPYWVRKIQHQIHPPLSPSTTITSILATTPACEQIFFRTSLKESCRTNTPLIFLQLKT